MNDYKKIFKSLGIEIPTILIPKDEIDLQKWAVVACDQYTSEPEYWQSVANNVADDPSTLNLVYPECFLEEDDPDARISSINKKMEEYIDAGIFKEFPNTFFLLYRETKEGFGRWGLVVALDLERYDFSVGSTSLIRATEGTIIERIPPRKRIRKDAPLEFPHIIVLIDDDKRSIIEPLAAKKDTLKRVYSFPLMKDSGSIEAYAIDKAEDLQMLAQAFTNLADLREYKKKYNKEDLLLFAMGDGNHSLATAKSCWEDIKIDLSDVQKETHPARFALVELENIFDEGLIFEPIHRVLFEADKENILEELNKNCLSFERIDCTSADEMYKMIHKEDSFQYFGIVDEKQSIQVIKVIGAEAQIVAATLQKTLDAYLKDSATTTIDYTHGTQVTYNLGIQKNNVAIFLPAISKNDFFSSIVHDGALPRKTFSMGEDFEKRFYIEGRKITE